MALPFPKTLPFPVLRLLASGATALFAALALVAFVTLAVLPEIPRWLAMAAVICAVAAAYFAGELIRLRALVRHRFRIVSGHHVVSFRAGAPRPSGAPSAEAKVRSEFLLEALRPGESRIRLQKFVAEPTGLDPAAMLAEWRYGCRIAGLGAVEPQPFVSVSRSFQLDLPLETPVRTGERFTLVEELAFETELESAARFVFQPSYPAGEQSIELVFDGPKPFFPRYRVERPPAEPESGEVGAMHPNRFGFVWRSAEPGEQLILDWTWDPESLPEPVSETERLIAEARVRQEEIKQKLATVFTEPAPEGPPGESAEEHWIIRAARAREAMDAVVPGAEAPPSLPGESGFADERLAEAPAAAANAEVDPTPAEEHPIIKAAREREKLYKSEN